MRCLGLLGGMSWESTAIYYRLLNEGVRRRAGGLHSAPLLLWSFEFAEIAALQAAGAWTALGHKLGEAGRRLADDGAQALMIGANTMHLVYDAVTRASGVPVIHVADVTAEAIRAAGCRRPLLLGTRFTMEHDFYRDRLATHGLDATTPDAPGREKLHRIIYEELCQGIVRPDSRACVQALIGRADADAVILGCTELVMLLSPGDVDRPLFDTTALHAEAGVAFMTEAPVPA